MKPETVFRTNKVRPFLENLVRTSHFPIQQRTIRGDADYILCSQGFFVWLELKDDGEEPQPLQTYKASCVKQTGGIALIATPSNWDQVAGFLTLLDRGIYDKNVLRSIEQSQLPKRLPKANADSNEGPPSLQGDAHRKESTNGTSDNAGKIQTGNNESVRPRRRRKQRSD